MKTYYIALKDGRTGGVDVEGNLIVAVPPIWNGWKGKSFSRFCAYYQPMNMYEVPNAKEQEETPQEQTAVQNKTTLLR